MNGFEKDENSAVLASGAIIMFSANAGNALMRGDGAPFSSRALPVLLYSRKASGVLASTFLVCVFTAY